jgi:hypothetical protein
MYSQQSWYPGNQRVGMSGGFSLHSLLSFYVITSQSSLTPEKAKQGFRPPDLKTTSL